MKPWSQLRVGGSVREDAEAEVPLTSNGAGVRVELREAGAPRVPRSRRRSLLQPLPVAGVLLVFVAIIGYLAVYSQATRRTDVLVAARDLPAGTILHSSDVRSVGLAGDRSVLAGLVPSRQLGFVAGRRLTSAVPTGVPLSRGALAGRSAAPAAFTLAVSPLHALGGELRAGDRVTVLATFESPSGAAQTRAIARDLEVLAVGSAPSGLDRASATLPVTLALPDPSLSSALAMAGEIAKIDLLRDGATAGAPIPAVTTRG